MTANLARRAAETQVALPASGLRGPGWPVEVVSLNVGRTVASYSAAFERLAEAKA
jgi:hypothetical protein